MLKIIKYLSYNKNKSKKNYNKCTKFKVSINFITNSYLLGIQKVQKLKMMKVQKKLKMMKKDRDPPRNCMNQLVRFCFKMHGFTWRSYFKDTYHQYPKVNLILFKLFETGVFV
jgi:hypothetical protein